MFVVSIRYAHYYREMLGIRANDVVHIMIGGNSFHIPFAVLGALYIGAVPAFGELWLPEETLATQVLRIIVLTAQLKPCFIFDSEQAVV